MSSELDFTDIAELVDRLDPRVVTCTYCGCVVDDIRVGHCDPPEIIDDYQEPDHLQDCGGILDAGQACCKTAD